MRSILAFLFGFGAVSSTVQATEIKVISVGTVSPVLHDLIPEYERQTGNKIQVNFGNPAVTLERLTKGDPADIVMVAGALWDQAEKLGRLRVETKTVLPATPYSIGMKPGTKPSIVITADDVKRVLDHVQSIALVDRSPSIAILMQSAGKMGIAPQVEAKTKIYSTGGAIAEGACPRRGGTRNYHTERVGGRARGRGSRAGALRGLANQGNDDRGNHKGRRSWRGDSVPSVLDLAKRDGCFQGQGIRHELST